MARTLPELGEKLAGEIEAAWAQPQPDWARRRLLVVRLIAQHELTVAEIMRVADVSRQTVFSYRDKVVAKGVDALLHREWAGARRPLVRGALAEEFTALLEAGRFRRARDAQAWLKKRARRTLSVSGVRKVLHKLGGKLKVPRKSHAKKNPAKAQAFKLELPARLEELAGPAARSGQPVRLWVLDEHRYGLLPVIRRVWAKRGVRVHGQRRSESGLSDNLIPTWRSPQRGAEGMEVWRKGAGASALRGAGLAPFLHLWTHGTGLAFANGAR